MEAGAAIEAVEQKIHVLRGGRVMLDSDLAALYGVTIKGLLQAVKRNASRFPEDFMIQLTNHEVTNLRSQFVTLDKGRGKHRKYLSYAFTEQGVAMLSSVLRSERAIRVNIEIMRAFVRLRGFLATHAELSQKIDALEKTYDDRFRVVFDAIRQLMEPPPLPPRRRIGFDLGRKGAVAVEFVALAPLLAAFLLVILQLSAVFTQAVGDVARAEAAAIIDDDGADNLYRPALVPVWTVGISGARH